MIFKRRNEIRFHKDKIKNRKKTIRHPKYIWQQRGELYDYHDLTHSEYVDGIKYKKLRKNPNPKDNKDAFYSPFSRSDVKSNFGRKEKWKLHPDDIRDIHKK